MPLQSDDILKKYHAKGADKLRNINGQMARALIGQEPLPLTPLSEKTRKGYIKCLYALMTESLAKTLKEKNMVH